MTHMSRRQPISEEAANKIYDILIEHAGCYDPIKGGKKHDSQRMSFVRYATEGTWTEFRFGGPLGFGGKCWNNAGRWYVNCYPEHKKARQTEIIKQANAALDKLFEETYGEPPQR